MPKTATKSPAITRVVLAHRHYGCHSEVREAELRLPFRQLIGRMRREAGGQPDWPNIDEASLIAALPRRFLPAKPAAVLLLVGERDGSSTGVRKPKLFRAWEKYFDCHSLTLWPLTNTGGK